MTNETVAPPANHVKVIQFTRSPKPSLLATAKVEITFGDDIVTVDDVRVLRNRQSQLWVAMPAYSIATSGGRSFEYMPSVILSTNIRRQVEDAVLVGFEQWSASQGENSNEKR